MADRVKDRAVQRRRILRAEYFLTLGALFVTSIGIEGVIRYSGYGDARPGETKVRADGLALPNNVGPQKVWQQAHGVAYSYNRHWFRGRDWAEPKPPGVYRIAVLGDSFVFGSGVNDEDTLPALLEAKLAASRADVEVVNLGVAGYNTEQEAILGKLWFSRLSPDLVVLVVLFNDMEAMPWNPDPAVSCDIPLRPLERLNHALLAHLYAYRLMHAALIEPGCQSPQRCSSAFFKDDNDIHTRCFKHSFSGIADEAAKFGATTVVLYYPIPAPNWETDEFIGRSFARVVARSAGELNLPFLDASEWLSGRDSRTLTISTPGDFHPNAETHGIVAAGLARGIEAVWMKRH